jgi:hypothetical protein
MSAREGDMAGKEDKFCKFCGVFTNAPCVDETDLNMYGRTIGRCSDARFSRLAEMHYDVSAISVNDRNKP